MKHPLGLTMTLCCLVFTMWAALFGQEDNAFITIDQYGGQKVPKSLGR
jgi:hypothetical protein